VLCNEPKTLKNASNCQKGHISENVEGLGEGILSAEPLPQSRLRKKNTIRLGSHAKTSFEHSFLGWEGADDKVVRNVLQALDPATVRKLYWGGKKSTINIGKMYGVNPGSLYRWMKEHDIQTREKAEANLLRRKLMLTSDDLRKLYWDKKMTAEEIGKLFGVKGATVRYRMHKYNIATRTPHEAALLRSSVKVPTSDELHRLYWIEGKSTIRIGEQLGVCKDTVRKWLNAYKLPIKERSKACQKYLRNPFSGNEAEKQYMFGFCIGDAHVCKRYHTIDVCTTTTHPAMIKLFYKLFNGYGHCSKGPGKSRWRYQWSLHCGLDESFEFLLKRGLGEPFYPFLAGYSDAEGCWMIRKSHWDGITFAFEIQSEDRDTLEQISLKLRCDGYHPTFGLELEKGTSLKRSKRVLNEDLYHLRLLRRDEVLSLAKKLLPYSQHQEKIRKIQLMLKIRNERSWIGMKNELETLRGETKEEVERCGRQAEEEYKRRREKASVGLRIGLESCV